MFQDPSQTGVVVVTLPEDMPVNEAIELAAAVQGELHLPLARLVVNAVMDPLFDDSERRELLVDRPLRGGDPGDEGLKAAARRAVGERVQVEALAKLRAALDVPTVLLPRLLSDVSSLEQIDRLAECLADSIAP
jgi:hypothetical protein